MSNYDEDIKPTVIRVNYTMEITDEIRRTVSEAMGENCQTALADDDQVIAFMFGKGNAEVVNS